MSTKDPTMGGKSDFARLETPETAGYRSGMKSSHIIGSKLGRLYDLPRDMPRELGDLLQALDRKMCRAG